MLGNGVFRMHVLDSRSPALDELTERYKQVVSLRKLIKRLCIYEIIALFKHFYYYYYYYYYYFYYYYYYTQYAHCAVTRNTCCNNLQISLLEGSVIKQILWWN